MSNDTMASEGLDSSLSEPPHGDFEVASEAPASHPVFSMAAETSTCHSPQGSSSLSSGLESGASEGALHDMGRAGPALVKQGYFSYGVDCVKHKSAMAPVLQMDLSSRSACDSILTWLDKQKVAGVMICIPKHSLEPTTLAFRVCCRCWLHEQRPSLSARRGFHLTILEGAGRTSARTASAS